MKRKGEEGKEKEERTDNDTLPSVIPDVVTLIWRSIPLACFAMCLIKVKEEKRKRKQKVMKMHKKF